MKKWIIIILYLMSSVALAQDSDEVYRNKPTQIDSPQPYFKILNKDSKIDQIPLLMTTVDVNISGMVAEVEVTQYYKNYGDLPLEAQYVFPGSTDAAVYHLDMQVGERLIEAKVAAKEEAQKTYDQAKKAGKTASLLEQGDPGLFTMNVANILPNDDIRVTLKYTEKIIPAEGRYRFRYPAVGRPSVLAKGSTAPQSYAPGADMGFDLSINIDAPLAIKSINSKNHLIEQDWKSDQNVLLLLDADETLDFKQDFIIDYDLRGTGINSGISLFNDQDAGYFLMLLQPPAKFKNTEIIKREYIFVVDSSGSMSGKPIENAKFIASSLLTELKPEEFFNVILFAGGSELLNDESLSATEQNVNSGLKMVDVSSAGGGTDLKSALEKINQIPHVDGVSRSLIVLTDGAIWVADETIKLLRDTAEQNVFVIGVSLGGRNDNAAIDSIAKAGQGLSFYATDDDDINQLQSQFLDYVRYPLLTDIQVNTIGFESVEVFPKKTNDLFAQKPLYLSGKFTGNKQGTIEITGQGNGNKYQQFFDLDNLSHSDDNEAIKYLWAKEKIDDLMFDKAKNKQAITDLGLSHNLLTQFTSFVAVDHLVRSDGSLEKVTKSPRSESFSGYGFARTGFKIGVDLNKFNDPQWLKTDLKPLANTELNVSQNRKSITFIMGEDSFLTNQFYQTAALVYSQDGKNKTDFIVDHLRDISSVKAYLEAHKDINKPWGLINIVSHSSPWSGLSNRQGDGSHQSMNLFSLNEQISAANFSPLNNKVVDGITEVRLIGCALGSQKHMLKALSVFLGGQDIQRPTIKAPYQYVYITQDDSLNNSNIYAFNLPWFISKTNNFDVIKSSQSDIDKNVWNDQPIEISFLIPDGNHVSDKYLGKLISNQILLKEFLSDLNVTVDDFSWQLKTLSGQPRQLIGKAYLITTKVDSVAPELLQAMDFNNEKMVSIAN